jgi:hypothetical protein
MTDFPLAGQDGLNYSHRWDDLRVGVTTINPAGSVAPPTVNETNGTLEFSASATNIVAVEVQMPHSWAQATPIRPHIHWRKKTQGTGNIMWQLTYEFVNRGTAFTDTPEPLTADTPAGTDDGTALVHHLTSFGDVAMTGKTISCMGLITISRLGGHDDDTYAGVAQLLEFDIHYQIDAFGSIQQFAKQGVVLASHGAYGLTINQ